MTPERRGNTFNKKKRQRGRFNEEREKPPWVPKTLLGRDVLAGKFASFEQLTEKGKVIREAEIIDYFFPDLEERILKIGKAKRPFRWVQRMTDSGRRNKYFVIASVGNQDGYVGLGIGKGKEYGSAISQAVRKARLTLINVRRGCGSWDCGCGTAHSTEATVEGKSGSVRIVLKPAPKGTGLVVNDISRDILELAGIKDLWSLSKGQSKTRANVAEGTFDALKKLNRLKIRRKR